MVKLHLIQGMAHVYDVFDTRHGTFIQFKVWNMYSIQGMIYGLDTIN